ncbi:MAG TPA: hypothetical protein VK784_06095 [Pseudonocardiaceae bacterium]|nr:hypothetical protein [Pseudonocardiaceae bacterium]
MTPGVGKTAIVEGVAQRVVCGDVTEGLRDKRMTLEVTDEARRFMTAQGFDPVYGARPLRRFIAREVETRISRALLTDAIPDGRTIQVQLMG